MCKMYAVVDSQDGEIMHNCGIDTEEQAKNRAERLTLEYKRRFDVCELVVVSSSVYHPATVSFK